LNGAKNGVIYETDNEYEPMVLDRISKSYDKGKTLFGFFKTPDGEPVTHNGSRVANRPFPRQVSKKSLCRHF
jgi:hypothetical protein